MKGVGYLDVNESFRTMPTLVVLTDPLPYGRWRYIEILRRAARSLRDKMSTSSVPWNKTNYRGHFAVTRSVVEGLAKASLPFKYNSLDFDDPPSPVLVLSGKRTLKQAMQLKRKGLISTLFAGPNIVVQPSDAPDTLASVEVDRVIVPCRWVSDVYESDDPRLVGKCEIWAAGIDVDFWRPNPKVTRDKIVIYLKNSTVGIPDYVKSKVEILSHCFLHYGQYDQEEYRSLLSEAKLMIGFSRSESQGMAWLEAWSMDVPTLIFDLKQLESKGKTFAVSTAPYLTEYTGAFFNDADSFNKGWDHWMLSRRTRSPREWVLGNLSDIHSARRIYALITGNRTLAVED